MPDDLRDDAAAMSDELTNDDLARMLEDAHAHSRIVKGVKHTVITTDALTMVLSELLRLRQEIGRLRAERDAAVAEAVRGERERVSVGFDVTLELEVSVANGHYATLEKKLRLPVPPSEDVVLFLDGDHDSLEITNIHWFEKGNLLHCTVRPRKEEGNLDDAIAYYKANGWTVDHEDRRGW